jgi:3-oxo-5-alpha-steroid 4-dehydrogenase 1
MLRGGAGRTFIYPLRLVGGKSTPFVVFLLAFSFCFVNGYLQTRWLTHAGAAAQHALDVWSPAFLAGTAMFWLGMWINWDADARLRNLRKPGETGYKIPRGGAFAFVSGANFFGEIVEWAGFAIASSAGGVSLPAVSFAAFTFCNIAPRAASHHEWYLDKFKEEYPKERKAVIPFIW